MSWPEKNSNSNDRTRQQQQQILSTATADWTKQQHLKNRAARDEADDEDGGDVVDQADERCS